MINYKLINTNLDKSKNLLIFTLDKEEYAIDALQVQEICRYEDIATVANMPSHIKGLKKLADKMALILDLRMLFNIQPTNYDEYTVIIIIKLDGHFLGLVVSEVKEVLAFTEEQMSYEIDFQSLAYNYYVKKVARLEERIIFILDAENLYDHEISHLAK